MPQAVKPKELTDSFVTMAFAMLMSIGLLYLLMVILFRSLEPSGRGLCDAGSWPVLSPPH